jgi:hypothetical protein
LWQRPLPAAFTDSLQAVYRQLTLFVDTPLQMRRFLLFLGLVALFAVPAVVTAASQTDGTLSVKRGRATIMIRLTRGTVIGRLANGQVRIKDPNPYDGPPPDVHHCRKLRYPTPTTTLCIGKKLTFRALDGRFVINVKGTGIYLSAVGRGQVAITGAADPSIPNGVMSIDNGAYQPIPDFQMIFQLGTSSP